MVVGRGASKAIACEGKVEEATRRIEVGEVIARSCLLKRQSP